MTMTKEDLVRITYSTPNKNEPTHQEQAARDLLQMTIERAIEDFQTAVPTTDVVGIEMHPCDCGKCR